MTTPTDDAPESGVYLPDAKMRVRRIEYDYETSTGCIHVPGFCGDDAPGVMLLFCRIDPNVRTITVIGADNEAAMYSQRHGNWSFHYLPTPHT